MTNAVTLASTLPTVTMARAVNVVQFVAEGETVYQACRKHGIAVASFKAALKREPLLKEMLEEAVGIRNSILNDMLVNIDLHHSDPRMAAVISKNIQWVLAHDEPEKFADRVIVDGNSEQSKLLAAALNEAMKRIPVQPEQRPAITDVTFIDVPARAAAPRVATIEEMKALGLL